MKSVRMEAEMGQVRPSRLIAEALVNGHDSTEVTQRAQAMGLSEGLTRAVVSVCCREAQEADNAGMLQSAD